MEITRRDFLKYSLLGAVASQFPFGIHQAVAASTVKIGIISDPHGTTQFVKKMGQYAVGYIGDFATRMNGTFLPDVCICGGDLISEISDKTADLGKITTVTNAFAALDSPYYFVRGNHDNLAEFTDAEYKTAAGIDYLNTSFDVGNYHFVILDCSVQGQSYGTASSDTLTWLTNDLAGTDKPSIVFLHHCLETQDISSPLVCYWCSGSTTPTLVSNASSVRTLLEGASNGVIAVVHGHMHWQRFQTINNIPYHTVNSIVEGYYTSDIPTQETTDITLYQDRYIKFHRVKLNGDDVETTIWDRNTNALVGTGYTPIATGSGSLNISTSGGVITLQ